MTRFMKKTLVGTAIIALALGSAGMVRAGDFPSDLKIRGPNATARVHVEHGYRTVTRAPTSTTETRSFSYDPAVKSTREPRVATAPTVTAPKAEAPKTIVRSYSYDPMVVTHPTVKSHRNTNNYRPDPLFRRADDKAMGR